MKKKTAICAMSVLISLSAWAEVKEASSETKDAVSALLSANVAKELAEFSQYVDSVLSIKINSVPGLTEYKISGVRRRGSDIICGQGEILIRKTYFPQSGFENSGAPIYQAVVYGKSSCK